MATSLRRAQIPVRGTGSSKCPHHQGRETVYVCENCGELACTQCVSTLHKGHALETLSNTVLTMKDKLRRFQNKAETIDVPWIREEIKQLDESLSKNKDYYNDVVARLKKQNNFLKAELDKITEDLIKKCRNIESENMEILLGHRQKLQTFSERIHSSLQECKDTLKSGTDVQVYDISTNLTDFVQPETPALQTTAYTPVNPSLKDLERYLGEISSPSRTSLGRQKDNHPDEHREEGIQQSDRTKANYVFSELTATFRYNIGQGLSITSLCTTSANQAWACFSPYKSLVLFGQNGNVIDNMEMEIGIRDICLSPRTGNIWFCSQSDNSVREVKGQRSRVEFHTGSKPLCICMTGDENIFICFEKRVVKYTQFGQVISKFPHTSTLAQVVYPRRMAECPVTGNIAVVDLNSKDKGGNGKPYILILDNKFQPVCTYHGDRPATDQQGDRPATVQQGDKPATDQQSNKPAADEHDIIATERKQFIPGDVCYNNKGELLVTDNNNSSVLIVSNSGRYIRTVYTESQPICICTDSGGKLWITLHNNVVNEMLITSP